MCVAIVRLRKRDRSSSCLVSIPLPPWQFSCAVTIHSSPRTVSVKTGRKYVVLVYVFLSVLEKSPRSAYRCTSSELLQVQCTQYNGMGNRTA